MISINQVIGTFTSGDAISNEALMMRDFLCKWGYRSNIYAFKAIGDMKHEIMHFSKSEIHNSDVLIYHYGGGDEIFKYLIDSKSKKILVYHNITPSYFFKNYDIYVARMLKKGRDDLNILSGMFDFSIADSTYNKKELIDVGFKNTVVLPVMVNLDRYAISSVNIEPDSEDKYARILFVGRISPNKMLEDLLVILYYYCKAIKDRAKLVIVGTYSGAGCRTYHFMLQKFIKELGIKNVFFAGRVDMPTLVAYYRWANIFMTMSQHEGFCVPLVESMYFGLPIIANNACAIPETLGDSGILVNNRNYAEIAELVQVCIEDEEFHNKIVNRQKERLKDFSRERLENTFKKHIERVIK